jgi:predicted enzyme related to lactoylglutathione lyase
MVGGLMPIPEEARALGTRPRWTGYIAVDDVDAYATRVKSAGGAIHRAPENIPGVGRFAVAADPHGAVFNLFKGASDEEPEPVVPGTPGHVGWHELHAGDGESAFAFYSGLFGWTKAEAMEMGPRGVYQIFAIDGAQAGGMMTKMPQTPAPFWLYYFNVDALDAAITRVKVRAGVVGAAVGVLAWFAPGLVGGGDMITQRTLAGTEILALVPLGFVVRFALGAVSYAAGTPGGLFAPLLVLGAQFGLLFGVLCHLAFPALDIQPEAFALVGMAALFTGVVRAPLTGVVLVTEMTASVTMLLPMLGACFAAMLVPTLLRNAPIYDSLRERMSQRQGARATDDETMHSER